ncbi:hypothetical protein EC991_008131 [Linnemannia zychae]|nr:hypothetical protein EC991_008131 [Linnemannia zychae]
MEKMKIIQFAVVATLATLFVSTAQAACYCLTEYAGKNCGRRPFMSVGCKSEYIYQCSGVKNSLAHSYGPCKNGCVFNSISKDYCA